MTRWALNGQIGENSPRETVAAVTRLGMLLALALILQIVEGMLPPLGFPGIKLGLANTVTLLALQLWGWRPALALAVLRQVLGGILTGKLFSVGFYLGLAGGLSAVAVMQCWLTAFRSEADLVTTSIAGAVAHNWGQWAAARFLINHQALVWYLPFLTVAALPCGWLVAGLCRPLAHTFEAQRAFPTVNRKGVAVILLLVVTGICFPLGGLGAKGEGTLAQVQAAGRVVTTLDLDREGRHRIVAGDHTYLLEIRDRGVRVLQADCPDQVCVRTGLIKREGQAIVCVPGKLVITVGRPLPAEVDGYLP